MFISNNCTLFIANAQQFTQHARQIDIKYFSLLGWVERDLVVLKHISTSDNYANPITISLGRQLHYRNNDYILGKIITKYAAAYNIQQPFTLV